MNLIGIKARKASSQKIDSKKKNKILNDYAKLLNKENKLIINQNFKDVKFAKKILEDKRDDLKFNNLSSDSNIAKISVVGMGMMSQTGVAEKMFKTLAENKINILAISTSKIKISVLIEKKYTELAIKSLHSVYKLDKK